jgi:tellurite resistance protein TehA-like permease
MIVDHALQPRSWSAPVSVGARAVSLERIVDAIPPASGAVVMGTGIVSVGLELDGRQTLPRILLALCGALWLLIGLVLAERLRRDPDRVRQESHSPASLTIVAATGVFGTGLMLLGWNWAGIVLLALGAVLWIALLGPVLRHWQVPTFGASLLTSVCTESLAVLAAAVAGAEGAAWLLFVAFALFVLGLVFYAFVIVRFDLRQLLTAHGDHWITGGALALATLAAARITLAAESLGVLSGAIGTLKAVTVALWVISIAWLPVLVGAELARPRPGYDLRRWATVFPLGMYAACSGLGGSAAHASVMTTFSRVWVWVALAVWLVVSVATVARTLQIARGERDSFTG